MLYLSFDKAFTYLRACLKHKMAIILIFPVPHNSTRIFYNLMLRNSQESPPPPTIQKNPLKSLTKISIDSPRHKIDDLLELPHDIDLKGPFFKRIGQMQNILPLSS